jgi:hypothetical protein
MKVRRVFSVQPESWAKTLGLRPISMKWIDTVKPNGKYRSRLVVREIKKAMKEKLRPEDVFSPMPPAESLKMLVSHMMTECSDSDGDELCFAKWDISRAHFYGVAERNVAIRLPSELHQDGMVGRLEKTAYGTGDAASIWARTWPKALKAVNAVTGKANEALIWSPHVKGFCHGDDFGVVASEKRLKEFGDALESAFDVKLEGIVGFAKHLGKELHMLNRRVCVDVAGDKMTIEADQKHVATLITDLGLEQAKPSTTTRAKLTKGELESREASPLLEGPAKTLFRSGAMRCKYLDQDRIDICEAVKCLATRMSSPREGDMIALKKLARYLKGQPRHCIEYRRQDPRYANIGVDVDSDWAGELETRKNTTGMIVRRGSHLLRHASNLQSTVSLSSAEAEFYAITKGSAFGLGMQSFFRDIGIELKVEVRTDSSSGLAFSSRRGLGRMRHVETRYLWVQERVRLRHLRIRKIAGLSNPADVLTKAVPAGQMRDVCKLMGEVPM